MFGVTISVADGEVPLRFDTQHFGLPFTSLDNAETCQNGPSDGLDGVWRTAPEWTIGEETQVMFRQVLDLAVVDDQIHGVATYGVKDESGDWQPGVIDLTGEIDGDWANFGFENEDFTFMYDARVEGMSLVDGTLTITSEDGTFFLDFEGTKLSNRCEGLNVADLSGHTISLTAGEVTTDFVVLTDGADVTLTGGGVELAGNAIRNTLIATGATGWVLLDFDDQQSGWAQVQVGTTISDGSFIVQ